MEPSARRRSMRIELSDRRRQPDLVGSRRVPTPRSVDSRSRLRSNRVGMALHRERREAVRRRGSRDLRGRRSIRLRQHRRGSRDLATLRLGTVGRVGVVLEETMKRSGPIQRRTPLRRVSPKTAKRNRQRAKFRREILLERPRCEAGNSIWTIDPSYADCGRVAVDLHEPLTRARGGSVLDPANVVATCRACHEWIHRYPLRATEIGLLRTADVSS